MSDTRPIPDIKIGARHRRDIGDVDALARSVADIGLLHPIVIKPDGMLIAGERRLAACRQIGWTDIPVTVIDIAAVVAGEFAENSCRKDFTLSESVAIKRALEPIERAAAKERQIAGRPVGNFSKGRALDKVAKVVGKDRTTLAKAEAIVDAAEEDPEKFGNLLAAMDRTGRVDGVHRRLKIIKQSAAIRKEPPPLPGRGPYRVIVADPPWPYEVRDEDPSHRGALPYVTMSLAQIHDVQVRGIAHEDCVLWLWTTNHFMPHAFPLVERWGFEHKTILTWFKNKMGMGDWLRGQTEHCILAVRGKPSVELTNQTTALHAPSRGHSQKPVEFYDLVESLCPAPRYAELFSRYQHNERWECHGDEAPPVDIPAELRRAGR